MKIRVHAFAGLIPCLLAICISSGCDFFEISDPNTSSRMTAAPPTEADLAAASADTSSQTNQLTAAAIPTAPVGGSGIGPQGEGGGFLWKPVSDSNGKLAVLLPPQYTGYVSACFIATRSGSVIEQGTYSSTANGNREHYRFSKPGSAYPAGVVVVADLKSGGSVHWPIPSPGSRTSY